MRKLIQSSDSHFFVFLKVCLASSSPPTFHFVLVNSLHRIITNVSLQSTIRRIFCFMHVCTLLSFTSHYICPHAVSSGLVAEDRCGVLLLWRTPLYVLRHPQPGCPKYPCSSSHDTGKYANSYGKYSRIMKTGLYLIRINH